MHCWLVRPGTQFCTCAQGMLVTGAKEFVALQMRCRRAHNSCQDQLMRPRFPAPCPLPRKHCRHLSRHLSGLIPKPSPIIFHRGPWRANSSCSLWSSSCDHVCPPRKSLRIFWHTDWAERPVMPANVAIWDHAVPDGRSFFSLSQNSCSSMPLSLQRLLAASIMRSFSSSVYRPLRLRVPSSFHFRIPSCLFDFLFLLRCSVWGAYSLAG
mmetsp:Transcript_153125/g.293252  ORF Transcript_153125/g.293252 Transcript_153125/m.293252 type:complete len:210 (+) Transcript_153125:297-926(+)